MPEFVFLVVEFRKKTKNKKSWAPPGPCLYEIQETMFGYVEGELSNTKFLVWFSVYL